MNSPDVSIVMPVFNAGKFVEKSLQSLLDQTFRNFELIIVDDCSTDKSLKIVSGFKDERIRILKNETNRGIVFSRNRGLSEIRGRFYAPFDADDIARKDKLEKQVKFLDSHPEFAMIGTWAKLIDDKNKLLPKKWKLNSTPERIPSIMLFRNYFVHSSIMVRSNFISQEKYRAGFDVVEDYKFCADIAMHHKVYNLPEYLIHYRVHDKSAMRIDKERMKAQDIKIYRYLFDLLKINLSETDLNCIFALKCDRKIDDRDLLMEIHNFLEMILVKNRDQELFDQRQLLKTITNRWLKACSLAKTFDMKLLSEMIGAPLTKKLFRI